MTINENLGYSSTMGPELRSYIEQGLLKDLQFYGVDIPEATFDWSESCIEGRGGHFLDGYFENYSGITIQNKNGETIVGGWMDFAENVQDEQFIFYWEFLDVFDGVEWIAKKSSPGIPIHIWNRFSEFTKKSRINDKMKDKPHLP